MTNSDVLGHRYISWKSRGDVFEAYRERYSGTVELSQQEFVDFTSG